MSAIKLLIMDNLRQAMRARGVWIVLAAALIPPALTGAWVFTHQNDVGAVSIDYEPQSLLEGQLVNITASVENRFDEPSGPFNVTLQVGYFEEGFDGALTFRDRASESFRIDNLAPGEQTQLKMNWTAQSGTFIFRTLVDTEDELPEIEENDNERFVQVQVGFPPVQLDFAPPATGDDADQPEGNVTVMGVFWHPAELYAGDSAVVTVQVKNNGQEPITNASVRLQVHRATLTGYSPSASPNLSELVDLAPGETANVTFKWSSVRLGQYALFASMDASGSIRDTYTADNAVVQETFIDRQFLYEEPEPKATAKEFYRTVLELLHLKLLIPLVALFYAAGVLEDEKERGNLAYILTRPTARWTLPVARLVVSFVVAGAALLAGVLATFLLLLGLPQSAPGYLYWPMAFSALALLVYTAVFVLVGVTVRKPYLFGMLYVLGFEALVMLGRRVLVNDNPLLQDWVLYLSLNHWVTKAFNGWEPGAAQYLPEGEAAVRAFYAIVVGAVACVAGASWWMHKREFDV